LIDIDNPLIFFESHQWLFLSVADALRQSIIDVACYESFEMSGYYTQATSYQQGYYRLKSLLNHLGARKSLNVRFKSLNGKNADLASQSHFNNIPKKHLDHWAYLTPTQGLIHHK